MELEMGRKTTEEAWVVTQAEWTALGDGEKVGKKGKRKKSVMLPSFLTEPVSEWRCP